MDTLKLDDLSSVAGSELYYLSVLEGYSLDANTKNVEIIDIEVDRGVDFHVLTGILLEFPNLKILKLMQNYACGVAIELDDFIQLLENLDLQEFVLVDTQSEFLKNIDRQALFKKLPSGCKYFITHGFRHAEEQRETHIDPANDKYMVFTC